MNIPSWVPGASFQNSAASMRSGLERIYNIPYNFVKTALALGDAIPSFVSISISELGDSQSAEELIKAAAASVYSGGAETTPSALTSFILAMILYPKIQRKAQKETDPFPRSDMGVTDPYTTNPGRLPSLKDRPCLPYINSIVQEVWRWQPSVPLGLPHLLTQDDEYQGYFIEKGTVVWANIWDILHDPTVFPDPDMFNPERFFPSKDGEENNEQSEAVRAAFGFGRRICPGLYLAENSVFIAIAGMLAIFDFLLDQAEPAQVEYDGFIRRGFFSCES